MHRRLASRARPPLWPGRPDPMGKAGPAQYRRRKMALRCAPIHACQPHALPSVATECTHLNARGGSR
eukprot:scaffold65130_cov72-Phaeocystis_antarctica.AAC.1